MYLFQKLSQPLNLHYNILQTENERSKGLFYKFRPTFSCFKTHFETKTTNILIAFIIRNHAHDTNS